MARKATKVADEATQADPYEGWFSVKTAGFELRLSSEQVRNACKKGHFPNVMKDESGRWRIPPEDVQAYKENPPARTAARGGGYMYVLRLDDEQKEKVNAFLAELGVDPVERKNKPKSAKAQEESEG